MTEVILHAEPGVVMSWEDFQVKKPPFSIALDGYVSGQTKYSPSGPFANFNHHEGVDRLATRSTCMQIFFSITLGLFDSFRKDGKRFAHVYVNDADQDVCLSYWLLTNPEKVASIKWEDPLTKFMVFEDFVDASAGAFPFDDSNEPDSLIKRQAWVFEPYTTARSKRILHSMTGTDLIQLIETISDRITQFSMSKGQSINIDTKPEIIGGGPGWKMIIETSIYARTSIYSSGMSAFVGMRERNDGNYTYVLGKMSPYVPFPLLEIYQTLNKIENLEFEHNAWGGSDIIGGSPRKTGSSLHPQELEKVINKVIRDT
jgi:hypothetical protein